MNEVGVAVLILVGLFAAFHGFNLYRAKSIRGTSVRDLDPAASGLLDGREDALVYFFSPLCRPCRAMSPVVEELMAAHPGRILKVDITTDPDTAVAFGVRGTPTLVQVRAGEIENVYLGAKPRRWIEKLVG
jgi:thioredoxin 1